ncbi:GAF domain-containing sensor histidine kinase [Luteolibacter sp. Populi]|uniref:GAF domain-containing sensor histidine kinase n=1 Tax=Luteolibacter sp. Populi TaxID=3230487 RepID=UPI003466FAB3
MRLAFNRLFDEARLQAVAEVLPVQLDPDADLDRIARLAARAVGAPTSLITLIGGTAQYFRGVCGAPAAMGDAREGPHTDSLCRHTVLEGEIVSIPNTAEDARFADNPIVTALALKAYLGIPLVTADGHILGTICVIDYEAREWSADEIDLLRDYAAVAMGHLEAVANNAKIRVAFDVALHDLKTPLSGLLMAASLVHERMDSVPAELRPLMKVVESSTHAAVKLVETLATERQGRVTSSICADPAGTMESILDRLRHRADRKAIAFEFDPGKPIPMRVPPWVLERILENLATNAIKYGPKGSKVAIRFGTRDGHGHFHIRDQGPGFSETDREKMYSRYARLSAEPTGNEASTGLGLSIVKRLADQHGGKVELVSGSGESAEFRVSFAMVG